MNGAIILGSRIRTLWKDENRTYNKDSAVLLTNIDPVVTYEDLEELSKQYGTYCTITYTSDKVDKFTKRAIIQYESVVAANTAVKGLNGLQLKEKNITAVINNRSDLIVVVKGDLKEAQEIILGKVEVASYYQENLH